MKQHIVPGAIAAAVAATVAGGGLYVAPKRVEQVQHSVMASKHAWPDLTDQQKRALADDFATFNRARPLKLLILCADGAACTDLAEDIDDAAELAHVDSALDRPVTPVGYGIGIFADAGNSEEAHAVAAAIGDVIGRAVEVKAGAADGYVMIVIGKHPQ